MTEFFLLNIALYIVVGLSVALVVFGLPGTWLIVLSSLGYWALGGHLGVAGSGYRVIALLVFSALLAEAIEFIVSIVGAKKMAVGNWTIVASVIGGIIGSLVGVPIPIIGSLIGLFAGAFAGALIYELMRRATFNQALKVAAAVLLTRIVAVFFKTAIAIFMAIYLFFQTI